MWEPGYLKLLRDGELGRRASCLEARLASCDLCPWKCRANRFAGPSKICKAGHLPEVAAAVPHFGEEPGLSGSHLGPGKAKGAGNIFFAHCNLRCVYCQNFQISQALRPGGKQVLAVEELAGLMLGLQDRGCHTIGLVTPTHFTSQIVRAVELAARRGLRTPLVYNTNSYDEVSVLQQLEGVVDIYLPDLRYSDDETAWQYSGAKNYVEHARAAVREMFRQVGEELVVDEQGLIKRGLIIRLLILPNDLAGIRDTLEWIREALSRRVTLSVMTQYFPAARVLEGGYPLLERKIRHSEFEKVLRWLDELGFENGWVQPLEAKAPDYYRPDFSNEEQPFADARDFLVEGDSARLTSEPASMPASPASPVAVNDNAPRARGTGASD